MDNSDPPQGKMSSEEFKLRLQLETSLLVWMRTSLALMGFGFVLARFGLFLREIAEVGQTKLKAHPALAAVNTYSGTALMVLGVVVLLVSVFNHRRFVVQLETGDFRLPLRWSLGVILSLIVAVLGVVMAVFLAVVDI
jgi:putative membrane protein